VTYLTQNVLAVQDVSKPLVAKHRVHIISVKKEFVFTRKLLLKLLLLSSFLVTLEKFKLQFKNNLFLYFINFFNLELKNSLEVAVRNILTRNPSYLKFFLTIM
jgi:hypothetical protein